MSLVDYASSSEDEEDIADVQRQNEDDHTEDNPPPVLPQLPTAIDAHNQRSTPSSYQQSTGASQSSAPSIEKLPDASLLLNSPVFASHQMSNNDHTSRVAAAMAESASRKREPVGQSSSNPRSKYPRSHLPHSKNVPETIGGVLVPPQLKGRSNVVTEDISKLFVRRPADPSH